MASVSVDAAVIDHTIPTYFAGLGFSIYRATTDYPNATYRATLANIAPEVLRLNPFHTPGTIASPAASFTAMKNLCLYMQGALPAGVGVWMGPTGAHPNSPAGTASTAPVNDPANIRGDGEGRSPNDHAAWLQDFIQAGIGVLGIQNYNEPDNSTGNGNDGPWYTLDKACDDWARVHHRQYATAMRNKAAALSRSIKVGGHVIGSGQAWAQGWSKRFLSGVLETGATWPYGDANWGYLDVLAFHPYQGPATTNQGQLNAIYWRPSAAVLGGTSSPATMSYLENLHAYAVANGHPELRLAYDEYGVSNGSAFAGLVDVAQAILGIGWQAVYNIDYITTWSGGSSDELPGDTGNFPMMPTTYVANTRACANRDLCFYFSRNYKRVVGFGQAGANTPSSGDTGGNNNAVPRLPWVAALNAAGTKLAVLVCNLDLTNAESFTFTWANAAATGTCTYRQLLSSTTVTGSTPLPTGTVTVSSSSITRSIEAGAAYLFEIPVAAGGGGGTAPVNTTVPAISGSSTQGATLSASTGAWSNSPSSFAYQWNRDGIAIAGATASTYATSAADVGHLISVTVTASNGSGNTSATSSNFGPIAAAVGGSALGNTTVGSAWSNSPGPGYENAYVKVTVPVGHTYLLGTAHAYLAGRPTAGTANMKVVARADVGGAPGQVVAVWAPIAIVGGSSPTAAGWKTASPVGSPSLPAGDYWVGAIADPAGADTIQIATNVGGQAYFWPNGNYGAITPGDAAPILTTSETFSPSIYVDFTESLPTRRASVGGRLQALLTPTLDTFSGTLSGWQIASAADHLGSIVGGRLQNPNVTPARQVWTSSFAMNQEAVLDMGGDQYQDILLRWDTAGGGSGYLAEYEDDTHNVNIYRFDAGVATLLPPGVRASPNAGPGTRFTFRAVDWRLMVFWNGTLLQVVTDSTYMRAGKIGLGVASTNDIASTGGVVTAFGGGTLPTVRVSNPAGRVAGRGGGGL